MLADLGSGKGWQLCPGTSGLGGGRAGARRWAARGALCRPRLFSSSCCGPLGQLGAVASVCWVLRAGVGWCRARCSPLLPEFQGMLKDVSEGKAPEPLAVLPAAGSQVRSRGQGSGAEHGVGNWMPRVCTGLFQQFPAPGALVLVAEPSFGD